MLKYMEVHANNMLLQSSKIIASHFQTAGVGGGVVGF